MKKKYIFNSGRLSPRALRLRKEDYFLLPIRRHICYTDAPQVAVNPPKRTRSTMTKSTIARSLLTATLAAVITGCGTTEPETSQPIPAVTPKPVVQPKPAPKPEVESEPAPKPDAKPTVQPTPEPGTAVPEQRFTSDIAEVLADAPTGPGGLWTNKVAAGKSKKKSGKAPRPAVKAPPRPDTSKYRDTTDDGKGKLTASGQGFSGEGPANVIDNGQSKWCIETKNTWLQYEYADGAKHKVTAYTIMSANDNPGRDPKNWKLLGSNDGKEWTEVDSRKDENFGARFETRLFTLKTPAEFSAYRLEVSENHGDVSHQYAEFELLEDK